MGGKRLRPGVRPKTLFTKRYPKELFRIEKLLYPENGWYRKPKKRGDCLNMPRPCPFVWCKHHLYLDVRESGSIVINYPDKEVWELEDSCVLDIIDKEEEITLEETGNRLNLTRERIRQIEKNAVSKIKRIHAPDLAYLFYP